MTQPSATPNLRVLRHAPDFYALPLNGSLLAASSTTHFEVFFRRSQPINEGFRVWRAAAEFPRTSTPLLHWIEFA
jgi:hypothetical protein